MSSQKPAVCAGKCELTAVGPPVPPALPRTRSRRFHAVRAHLLEHSGDRTAALNAYETGADLATSTQQQLYLQQQIKKLRAG
ncbi:MAG: hypothetical protein JWO14_1668 [Solirubrobacterales bacterium]|nr:hypothetical protein [Solirubrobacterales bacterium]